MRVRVFQGLQKTFAMKITGSFQYQIHPDVDMVCNQFDWKGYDLEAKQAADKVRSRVTYPEDNDHRPQKPEEVGSIPIVATPSP